MSKGIYIRTERARKNIGRASKGRHALLWHIRKYGESIGNSRYRKWCELRSKIAKTQPRLNKGKTYAELYGKIVRG